MMCSCTSGTPSRNGALAGSPWGRIDDAGISLGVEQTALPYPAIWFPVSSTNTRLGFPGSILFFFEARFDAPPQLAAHRVVRSRPGFHQHQVVDLVAAHLLD